MAWPSVAIIVKRGFIVAALAPAVLITALPVAPQAVAQRAQTFEVRLAATPRDTAMREIIAGHGAVQATLVGRELTLMATFEGLKSPATQARIHMGPATAVRGPAIHELEVSQSGLGMAGTISGVVELGDGAVAALDAGHLYIQLDSEGAPDGNLWGWLLREAR